jgi:hypothetical protein
MLGAAAKSGLSAQLTGRLERGASADEAANGAARWLAAATLYDTETCRWLAHVFAQALGFDLTPADAAEGVTESDQEEPAADAGAPPDEAALAGIAPEAPDDDAQAAAWAGMSDAELRSAGDLGEITVIAPFVGVARVPAQPQQEVEASPVAPEAEPEPQRKPERVAAAPGWAQQAATTRATTEVGPPAARPTRRRRVPGAAVAAVVVLVLVGGYFVVAGIAGLPPLKKSSTTASGVPSITGISPSSGSTAGGTLVTVSGAALSGATVTVAGKSVPYTCTATSCSFTAPAGAGSEPVVISTSAGSASTTFVYPSVSSNPPAWLATVFPDVSDNCSAYTADKPLQAGLTSSFTCGDTYLGSSGAVVGFLYDDATDYQAGVGQFNTLFHFDDITAGGCPPSGSGSNAGEGWWYDSHFNEIQDQSLECLYTSGPSQTSPSGKTEVFLFPSVDAFVMVWGPSLPWGSLQEIWCQNCVGAGVTGATGSGSSSSGAVNPKASLSVTQLLPADIVPGADCKNWTAPHTLQAGLGGSVVCNNSDLGGNGSVIGYKWSTTSDYSAGLAALNSSLGFDSSTASSNPCPPTGSTPGEIQWSNGTRYPRATGQVLECFNSPSPVSGGSSGPIYIEAIPSQHALLEFSAPLLTWAQLNTWYLSPADGLL